MHEATQGGTIVEHSPEGAVVLLDVGIYRLQAIKKAAYRFGDRCHVLIKPQDGSAVRVVMRPRTATVDAGVLAGEFCNEVLDQELREVVAEETQGIRSLLLAHAFSRTSLINQEAETADYQSDPAHLAQSRGQ